MLRALRSGGIVQGVMVVVIGAIIAVFVLEFRAAGGAETGSLTRHCVVKVQGHCLDPKDFYAEYNLVVPRGVPAKTVRALGLRENIVQGLVERELLVAEAGRIGVGVSQDALDGELAQGRAHVSLPAEDALRLGFSLDLSDADSDGFSRELVRELPVTNPKTGNFDLEIYKRVVRSTVRRSPKEFKEMQERELIASRMRDLVRSRVRLSDSEAFNAFVRDRSRAVVRLGKLEREWFARFVADASDAAAESWAKGHQKDLDEAFKQEKDSWKPGCALMSEIRVSVAPDSTDDDKVLLRERLDDALERSKAGASFYAIARAVSEGPTAASGGFVGCFDAKARGDAAEPIQKALAGLEEGEVSDIIETEGAWYIVRNDGKLEAEPEERARLEIARRKAVAESATEVAQEYGKKLIEALNTGVAIDEAIRVLNAEYASDYSDGAKRPATAGSEPIPLADKRRPQIEISAPFNESQNPITNSMPTVSPAEIAFGLEKEGAVHPELIPTFNGFAVMQLKEKKTATRDEYEKEKAEVMGQLLQMKQNDALVSYVDRLRETYKDKVETNLALVEDKTSDEDAEG